MRGPRFSTSEPVNPDTVSPSRRLRALRQAGLALLCGAWVALGLVGHDPWKTEDAITFATAWEMVQRGDYLIPHIAQFPAFDRAPLMALCAAAMMNLFSPPLAPYDAARLSVGLLLMLVLGLTAWTGRELNGRAHRWVPVLVLIGSLGLFDRGHQMAPEIGLMLAVALALYGLALALRSPAIGGALLGVAFAVGFLAFDSLSLLWIGVSALAMPLAGAPWRTRGYAVTLAVALTIALPLAVAWPLALYLRSPSLLEAWWQAQALSNYVPLLPGAGALNLPYFPKNIVWFAWPAVPLIVWTLWVRGRGFNGGVAQPGVQVPGVMAIVILTSLVLMPDPRLAMAVPLLVPLALLASVEVDSLERGMSAALDWFGILTFGLTAVALWLFWVDSYVNGMSPRVALILRDTETGYGVSFRLAAVVSALLLTTLWVVLVRPARRSNRRAVLNWAAGVTLIWGLASTIWLPYIDSRRTYRLVAESIASQLPRTRCVASRNLGDAQRALFYYFTGIVTVPVEIRPVTDCGTLLAQYGRLAGDVPPIAGWRLTWSGARRGDRSERFAIYVKEPS